MSFQLSAAPPSSDVESMSRTAVLSLLRRDSHSPRATNRQSPKYPTGIIAPGMNVVNLKMEEFARRVAGPINSLSIGGGNRNQAP